MSCSDQTNGDAKSFKSYTEQEDARLDKQLRIELDVMSKRLEAANSELMAKLAALEGITFGGKGGSKGTQRDAQEPPGLEGLVPLQATVQAI